MNLVIVPKEIFSQMQAIKPLDSNEKERREMKYSFLDRIKGSVKRRWNKAVKLTRVIDEIIFKATDRGYSFNGKETLAKLCDCGISTVEEALRVLKESGEAIIAYRENPNSNGYKTPVVILKNHPHFSYWNDLLGLDEIVKEGVDQEVENSEFPCESKDEQPKKVSTYSLPIQQERDNNKDLETLRYYFELKIQDILKSGFPVKYISAYINKVTRSLKLQSLYTENERDKAKKKQQQEENRERIRPQRPVPFYNWLEQ